MKKTEERADADQQRLAYVPDLPLPGRATNRHQLINRLDQPAWGAGQITTLTTPPATANAIFHATGKRLRNVPLNAAQGRGRGGGDAGDDGGDRGCNGD